MNYKYKNIELFNNDCLLIMDKLISEGVKFDAIISDPPYGTTSQSWDKIIPFDKMWSRIDQLIKPNAPVILFGTEPFSSALRLSNLKEYKYDWIWIKNKCSGYLNCKNAPMKKTELIHVFSNGTIANGSKNLMPYYPQGLIECEIVKKNVKHPKTSTVGDRPSRSGNYMQYNKNYPNNVLNFDVIMKPIHSTQKPIELCEYLVKTYTKEGDLILDFTAGVFSIGIACLNTNRKYIGIEKNLDFYNKGKDYLQKFISN